MWLLLVLAWALLPGCGALKGPGMVQGLLGGSLSVTCMYRPGQETLPKFWCKPAPLLVSCATDLVITSESEPEVRWGRFSIRDNRTHRAFTVTVERLSKWDAGTFRCGVQKGKVWPDEVANVEVIVYPAPTLPPDASNGTRGTFRYFPVLAGLQLLALLAMIAAVLWVSLRGR